MMRTSKATSVAAKICGLKDRTAIQAAVDGGARYVGFVFYSPSPRAVTPAQVQKLSKSIPPSVIMVGLFVDPGDKFLQDVLEHVALDFIQLHGGEDPNRVRTIKALTNCPVLKAGKVANGADVDGAVDYDGLADMLLFDAKAPKNMHDALPGGNGLVFNWILLANRHWRSPWMLSGGLDPENVSQAVSLTRAQAVDVSSGVESAPGEKDPAAIKAFLDAVKAL